MRKVIFSLLAMVLLSPVTFGETGLDLPPWLEEGKTLLQRAWTQRFRRPFDLKEAGWTIVGPDIWRVRGGELDGGSSEGVETLCLAVLPAEVTRGIGDYYVRADIWNTMREGSFLIAVRYRDPQNYYAVEYASSRNLYEVSIIRMRNGVRTVLDSVRSDSSKVRIPNVTAGAGAEWGTRFYVGAIGNRIFASAGDSVHLRAVDSSLGEGGIALGHTSYHPFFDNIEVFAAGNQRRQDGPIRFRIRCKDRDDALVVIEDLREAGVSEIELVHQEDQIEVLTGPIPDERTRSLVRTTLGSFLYEFEEEVIGDE